MEYKMLENPSSCLMFSLSSKAVNKDQLCQNLLRVFSKLSLISHHKSTPLPKCGEAPAAVLAFLQIGLPDPLPEFSHILTPPSLNFKSFSLTAQGSVCVYHFSRARTRVKMLPW